MSIVLLLNIFFTVLNLVIAMKCEIWSFGFNLNVFASAINAVFAAQGLENLL